MKEIVNILVGSTAKADFVPEVTNEEDIGSIRKGIELGLEPVGGS